MSFFINSINPFAFTGQIISYLGTTDPEGWVICDGSNSRLYNSKYDALNTGGKYIPPDLRNYILRGKDTTNDVKTTSGSNTNVSVNISHFPNHNHGTKTSNANTQSSHTHSYTDVYFEDDDATSYAPTSEGGDADPGTVSRLNSGVALTTGNGIYSDHTVTLGEAGANDSVSMSIMNHSYRVNWILKL